MATNKDDTGERKPGRVTLLPTVAALVRAPSSSLEVDDPTPTALGPPEQLGFDLRFEAGRTLLALKDRVVDPGVVIARALFEVPDVDYPLNVSGGPQQFQNRRLSLRAIELTLTHASLYVPDQLRAAGFTLLRERSRAGGIELLVQLQGASGGVPVRARGLFAPVGEAGCALVLHEVISFSPLPRPRAEIAQQLLNALSMPGAQPARAMLRRADPFRAVLARLLPQYGWKVPAVSDVRVHEVLLGKGEVTLRAWARELPEGWKAPRDQKRGPLEEAVALAVFADGMVDATSGAVGDELVAKKIALVDRLLDEVGGATGLAPSVVPFAAEILRADPRRRAEAQDLLAAALAKHEAHLGLLAALAEDEDIAGRERAHRLAALGKAADLADEPWVAARAFLVAAEAALADSDQALALECAEAAFLADPSVPETGVLTSTLLVGAGDLVRGLAVGRTALERAEDPSAAETFAIELAKTARQIEGIDSARVLLRRALRRSDRKDALTALIDLEVESGALERAAELLTRLLLLMDADASAPDDSALANRETRRESRANVELLAARLAEARGDRDTARLHLAKARELRPTDTAVAVRLATLLDDAGHLDKALEVLREASDATPAQTSGDESKPAASVADALLLGARLLLKRRSIGDPQRARALLLRLAPAHRTAATARVDAEAQALLGEPTPLAHLVLREAHEASDAASGSKQFLEAARLFADANAIDSAAHALAQALPHDSAGVAEVLWHVSSAELVRALGTAHMPGGQDLSLTALHAVAGYLAGAGRPLDAHALLQTREDRASVEMRATFGESAADVPLEIAERERLVALVSAEHAPDAANPPRTLAPLQRRLGALHVRPGGRGPGAAADAWEQAAYSGSVDLAAWLEAALAAEDGPRLAAVLRRDDVDVQNVPSSPLRAALATLSNERDATLRLRLAGQLASRADSVRDVEDYLLQARALPPTQAANAFAEAAARHGRVDWLLAAADILERNDLAAAALNLLLDSSGLGAAGANDTAPRPGWNRAAHEKAFALAASTQAIDALETTAAALLACIELDHEARIAVHTRRTTVFMALDPARGIPALCLWLDADPGSVDALGRLVPDLLQRGEPHRALERLEAASTALGATGDRAAWLALVHKTAGTAQELADVAAEIGARELLLCEASTMSPEARATELARLADLYGEAGRVPDAIGALSSCIALGGPDDKLAALYLRQAALEEDHLRDKAAAARSLEGRLRHTPDDAHTSKHLRALFTELGDDVGLLKECARRAARLKPGAKRAELWLTGGDAALRLDRPAEARALWMRALRSKPFSPLALDRLLAHGRASKSHHLTVRARVVAAHTIADGAPAAEQAAEAGACLYALMGRPRLALAAFRFAARNDPHPARHIRVIVDLHRALHEGPQALTAIDQLLAEATEEDKVGCFATRAEILEELLGDKEAAAHARRQALALDPTRRTVARSLSQSLREAGDLRGALEVDRAWADAALAGEGRGDAYALLSARAEEELADLTLCAEMCAVALALAPTTEVLRRHVRALLDSAPGDHAAAVEAIGRLLQESLPLEEKLALVLQKASIEGEALGQHHSARKTLEAGLADPALSGHIDADRIIDALALVQEADDEPAAAAELLLGRLAERPQGTPVLGDRRQVLERAAGLLDHARDRERALTLLEEAAALQEGMSRAGELRRARLAEELSRPDIAVRSLERMLTMLPGIAADAEERVALLGRLAVAAEKQGDAPLALSSWQQRGQRAPGDADTLRHIERLAHALSRPADGRGAADALLRLDPDNGGGGNDERCERLLACARDSRDRLGDAAAALQLFARARSIATDVSLRRESLACAEAAADPGAALALLDEMGDRSDPLGAGLLLRRAELRLRADGETAIAFQDLLLSLDLGALHSGWADPSVAIWSRANIAALVVLAAARDAGLVARALLDRARDGGESARVLRAALTPAHLVAAVASPGRGDPLSDELVTALANALPIDCDFALAAAERARAAGQGAAAADRLWALADELERSERHAAEGAELTADLASAAASLSFIGSAERTREGLCDRGALALLSSAASSVDVLARMQQLRPSLVRQPQLRPQALIVLRDAEAWAAVASVLEDALVPVDAMAPAAADARALRMELVSVLRTGLGDEGRAASHLQVLVEMDPEDRQAWGELLECLDALGAGHRARLATALGARAALVAGIEKREMVRRRAGILLELGRGEDALSQLVEVRAELLSAGAVRNPGMPRTPDPELKLLERRIHEARGTAALAAFLAAELQRSVPVPGAAWGGTDPGRLDAHLDAEALLALDPAAAQAGARAHAHLVLVVDEETARARARTLLDAPASADRRIAEAVAVAEQLGDGLGSGAGAAIADRLRYAFLEGLAARAHVLGSASALALSDALFARGIEGTAPAFGAAPARRRWRIEGPRRVALDIERLEKHAPTAAGAERRVAAAIALRRASRVGDIESLTGAAAALELPPIRALRWHAEAAALLADRAALGLAAQAASANGLIAAVRVGDVARGHARLQHLSAAARGISARRARYLKLTPERLTLRLALAPSLPSADAVNDLTAAVELAVRTERWQDAAVGLDALAERGRVDARMLLERADIAWRLRSVDAPRCSTRAAEALMREALLTGQAGGPLELRHRRKAVEGLLREASSESGTPMHVDPAVDASVARHAELAAALVALAHAAPDDASIQAEALAIAEAAGLHEVVDALMAEAAERAGSASARSAAIRKRAIHRLEAQRDADGACEILLQGALGGDATLREAAYQLAASEGLIEAQLEVVDDDLARAGLLALLGKSAAASELAHAIDSPAAWLLLAELAALEGDVAGEGEALEKLGAFAATDAATLSLLVGLDHRRGKHEEAAVRAADLVARFGPGSDRLALLLDLAAGGAGASQTAHVLRALLAADAPAIPPALRDRAVDVWEVTAMAAGLPADARAARLRRCRARDEDILWLSFLLAELSTVSADEGALWLRPLLSRKAILRELVVAEPAGLEPALALLVRTGDASAVADALGSLQGATLSLALASELASALEVLGRPIAAARALLQAPSTQGARVPGQRAARAARLFVDGGEVRSAVEILLAVPLSQMSNDIISIAREVSSLAGGHGAPLLVRIALASGVDVDVDAALSLAEQGPPDVALAVAGWRLTAAPQDAHAWRLIADRGTGAIQQHFAVALALRRLAPWPEDLVLDAARARRLRERTLPIHVARAWAEAGRPRTTLQAARLGADRASRGAAWRELAANASARKDEIGAARMLVRAGVPMSAAPIEVRLAADPAIVDPALRAAAIAEALGSPELAFAEASARRAELVSLFDDLDSAGFAGARLRQRVHASRGSMVEHIDARDLGRGVDPAALFRLLGRRPSPALRTTAAAVLASAGREDLAVLVDPRITTRRPLPAAAQAVQLKARAQAAESLGRPLEAAGLLRLIAALLGYDAARERAIQILAEKAGRIDLVAESLGRMAGATQVNRERAALLRERALTFAGQPDDASMMRRASDDARFACELLGDDVDTAKLWLQLAEMRPEPPPTDRHAAMLMAQDVASALGAVARTTRHATERSESAAKRARILMDKLGDSAAALIAVDEALRGRGLHADHVLLETRARALAALGRLAEGARAYNDAAAASEGPRRKDLRRAAADAFASADCQEDAIATLLTAVAEGDRGALALVEPLARTHAGPKALAAVLELMLKATQEPQARRALALERAHLLAARLDDRAGATALLQRQAADDATDAGARLALAEYYLLDHRFLDGALAYESAALIPGLLPLTAGMAAREAACILASLGDLERAGPLAESALDAGVLDQKLLAVAVAWSRAHGRHGDVDVLLGRQIALAPDARAQATLWMDRAQLHREQLHDLPAASNALHRALELVPDDAGALAALRVGGERDGAWAPLRAALSRALDVAGEQSAQVAYLLEIALLDADHFNDFRAAEAAVDRALALDADHADSLALKARLLVHSGQLDDVQALIARAEKAGAGELPGLMHMLRGDGLLLGGDREGAREAFNKATRDPATASKAWDRLIDLADGTPLLLHTLQQANATAAEPKRKVSLLRREARARSTAGDAGGHFTCCQQLLALEPGDSDALAVVRDTLRTRGQLTLITPLLSAWARAGAGDTHAEHKERARRLAELGTFLLDELGDAVRAREAFEEALALADDEPTSLVRLADILWAARDHERALAVLDRIEPGQWPHDPVDLAYRRACCASALGRDDAQVRLRAVLRLDAKHQDALGLLAKLALATEDHELAQLALESLVLAISPHDNPARLAAVHMEIAGLRGRQGRWLDAVAAAERACGLAPDSVEVLESLASALEAAGQHREATQAWHRLEGAAPSPARSGALERRALALCGAGRCADAVEVLLGLYQETGAHKYRDDAEAWARQSGDAAVIGRLAHVGAALAKNVTSASDEVTRSQAAGALAAKRETNAFHRQARAKLAENDPASALRVVAQAVAAGAVDEEILQLGVEAAERAQASPQLVELIDVRLKQATDVGEVKQLARLAARIAAERLGDLERAAALLYLAHQADAEDVEVRLELTQLYAKIPRLAAHAVTGVLQLLRRTPADPRVFALAAESAASQQMPERARAMRSIEAILSAKGAPAEMQAVLDERPAIRALDADSIQARLAPTGWGRPLQQLLALLGSAVETALGEPPIPRGMVPLQERSPRCALALDRLERALPGRPLRLLCGDVERMLVLPGVVPHIVLPEDILGRGDAALLAMVARAYGLVRLGAVLSEVLKAGEEAALVAMLHMALVQHQRDQAGERLLGRLRDDELATAKELAKQAFAGTVDMPGTLGMLSRAADRFALVVSGSIAGALHAGAVPTLVREPPQRAAQLVTGSVRALDLTGFAARDNTWLLRRQHGFSRN